MALVGPGFEPRQFCFRVYPLSYNVMLPPHFHANFSAVTLQETLQKDVHTDITTDTIKQMIPVNHVYLFGKKKNTYIY